MNLRLLAALLIYWGMWAIIFSLGASVLYPAGYSNNINLTGQTGATGSEITTGGIFGSGLSFGRFLALTFFGIGLPSSASAPGWALVIFGITQSCITIFGVGFFLNSIWSGG